MAFQHAPRIVTAVPWLRHAPGLLLAFVLLYGGSPAHPDPSIPGAILGALIVVRTVQTWPTRRSHQAHDAMLAPRVRTHVTPKEQEAREARRAVSAERRSTGQSPLSPQEREFLRAMAAAQASVLIEAFVRKQGHAAFLPFCTLGRQHPQAPRFASMETAPLDPPTRRHCAPAA